MTRAPALGTIHAVELEIDRSRRNTVDRLRRARVALRANLVRPGMLALAIGAAGLLGFWFASRQRQQAVSSSGGVAAAATTSVVGLVFAFAVRFGMQQSPGILQWLNQRGRAGNKKEPLARSGE